MRNNRGQDSFVHTYVVAQDANLQHTYYEDIDVNDIVVSIADNDPAYVISNDKVTYPTEVKPASVSLRLASEPLYEVTMYLQVRVSTLVVHLPPTAVPMEDLR